MTAYINWMAYSQEGKDGTFQTQGNTVADFVTVASAATSAVAPVGSQYATIVCSVASKLEATYIGSEDNTGIYCAKELYCGANERVEIPNITAGKTTITVTDV